MSHPDTSISARLRRLADPLWQAQLAHPFVRGIAAGSLDPDLFGFWLRQDYLFLLDYARVFAFAAARAPDVTTMTRFATLMHETLHGEMELHRSYVAEFGITVADLGRETKAPTTQGYTDFLLHTAATADLAEVNAALLPCMWGYSWLGQTLAAEGRPADERYARWIEAYSSADFAELAGWCRDLVDATASGLSPKAFQRVETAFLTSSRYELAFWDMAWHCQTWPSTSGVS
ncbi:MAG TPA: thiaminase II [Thermomicrobiales bacterium]|nr:thiaminase II [Thermomicrobiales bacterium]